LYRWPLRRKTSAWAYGGLAGSSLCGGTPRATGDAGGAAGGKARSTEVLKTNILEYFTQQAKRPAPRRLLISV